MPYGQVARAILSLIYLVARSVYQESDSHHYQEKRRYYSKEAPAKKYEHAKHATDGEHRTAEEYQWRIDSRMTALTTSFAAVAVILTYCTFQATREQAQDGHTNLILSQSAFVYGNPVKAQIAAGQSPPSALFVVPIGNSGSTQTRGLRYQIACTPAANFSQVKIIHSPGHDAEEKLLLGPKAEISPVGCQVSYSDLVKYKTSGEKLFIFGNATYYDVLNRETPHKTEFCYVEAFADVQAASFDGFTTSCPAYNCADDECPDYQDFVRSMKAKPKP